MLAPLALFTPDVTRVTTSLADSTVALQGQQLLLGVSPATRASYFAVHESFKGVSGA
jgi:hypothetical protein